MSQAASEVTWVVRLLKEIGIINLRPMTLNCDNQSAIYIGKKSMFHERTKHVEVDCHFTRDKVDQVQVIQAQQRKDQPKEDRS